MAAAGHQEVAQVLFESTQHSFNKRVSYPKRKSGQTWPCRIVSRTRVIAALVGQSPQLAFWKDITKSTKVLPEHFLRNKS
jgi:hypothetical protein